MKLFFFVNRLQYSMASPVASHSSASEALLCKALVSKGESCTPVPLLSIAGFKFIWQQERSLYNAGIKITNRLLIFFGMFFLSIQTFAQDSLTVDYLLDRMETQQLKRNSFFMDGIFPSYISGEKKFKTRKEDNTIFYNAMIAYVLKENYNEFSAEQKNICDSIIA